MTTYVRYICDKCNREIETELDPLRPSLDKCNITYRCEGKLKKIGEKKLRSELVPLPQAGVDSWRQRGSESVAVLAKSDPQWITFLTSDNYITVALKQLTATLGDRLTLQLNMLSNSVRPFVEYTYSLAPGAKIITGLDINSKNLRFSVNDEVHVYLNGVKQYSLDPTDSSNNPLLGSYTKDLASFSVKFANALIDASTVKIVVYGVLSHVTYDLIAEHNVNTQSNWGNVQKCTINNEDYYLYHANVYNLPINYYFSVSSLKAGNTVLDLSSANLLLSSRPFTTLDRVYNAVLPLSTASQFNKSLVNEIIDFRIKDDAFLDIYPFISITRFDNYPDVINSVTGFSLSQSKITSNTTNGPAV